MRQESKLEWGDFDVGDIVHYSEEGLPGLLRITSFALYPDEYGQSRAYGVDYHGLPTAAFVKNLRPATDLERVAFEQNN